MTPSAQADRTPAAGMEAALVPPVDVVEDAAGITLYADLPGVPRERLSLHVEGETLSIEGDIVLDVPDGLEATHTEVGALRYRRVFTLSRELDVERVSAELAQGVLTLRIPKAEQARPRKIAINVE